MKGGDNMTSSLNSMDGSLTTEEEAKLNEQFIKDNFCPFDEDPFTYEHEGINLFDESIY